MARVGNIHSDISLRCSFYANGVLITPYNLSDVRILDAVDGTLLATVTPTVVSLGLYEAVYTIPAMTPGTYYDEWTWTAINGMDSQTRTHSFRVDAATNHRKRCVTGPLFVGGLEVDFFNSITKEVIQKIVSQKVIYYSVSEKHTKSHGLYDEAIKKTVFTPVEINALVLYNEPNQTVTQFSIDTVYSIEIYFHYSELEERNVTPREGDFVKFGTQMYEIEKMNQPQIVYGQMQNKVMVKAICRTARKSQFEVLDDIKGYNE